MKKIISEVLRMILLTGALFVFLEGICFLAGIPRGASRFVEKIIIHEHLTCQKPIDEIRIFTYGESTMHGSHYAPASSPARWLSAYLHDFLPEKKIRVINFARMGHESDFITRAFADTVIYKPDIVIFYMGHNEMLPGNLNAEMEHKKRKFRYRVNRITRHSRLISEISRHILQSKLHRKVEKPEDSIELKNIETVPIKFSAENRVPRGSDIYNDNIATFEQNLAAILEIAKKNQVKVLFFKPASNLKDFSPTESIHIRPLSTEFLERWNSFYEKGKQWESQGHLEAALAQYEEAFSIDSSYADLAFRIGRIYFQRNDFKKAYIYLVRARDDDALVTRATTEILNIFERLNRTQGVPLLDAEKILGAGLPGGILGEPVIEDNVHPSIEGQSLLALAACREMAERNWISPQREWKFDHQRPYAQMLSDLGVNSELEFSVDLKMVYYFGHRYENRLRFAKKALAIHPNDPRALRHLAWTYWLMNKKEDALKIYQTLQQIDSASLEAVFQNQPEIKIVFRPEDSVNPNTVKSGQPNSFT